MTSLGPSTRRYAHGAEVSGDGASFRVWAERAGSVELVLSDGREIALTPEAGGWFSGRSARVSSPALAMHSASTAVRRSQTPRPGLRFQGPTAGQFSSIPRLTAGNTVTGRGIPAHGQVIYEIHVGTFTKRGTWAAAAERLPHLAALGVTVVEMMPIADFRGRFGWGYDGALSYAPTGLYGTPDDLRAFVDAAHGHGIGVILDVVYNHFGPGNRFAEFSDRWFTDRYENEWGDSPNFDGEGCGPVRDYVAENAAYWIAEFGFDGLRLDATQALFDASAEHIIARIAREARVAAGGPANPPHRRERTAGDPPGPPGGGRRLRPRRALERRLPPFRARRPDRPARSLLPRLPGSAAGVGLGGAIRLSVPGAAVRLAGRAARHAGPLAAADRLRHLPREPRSGRQLGARPAAACAGEPRAPAGADGAAPAVAADPNAVPGAGVLGFRAVSLLCRSRPRA